MTKRVPPNVAACAACGAVWVPGVLHLCCTEPPALITRRVAAFHAAAGQPVRARPTIPEGDEVRLRAALIAEEFVECMEAMFPFWPTHALRGEIEAMMADTPCPHLASLADGLADLDYVVEGTRLVFGIPREEIEAEVHRANIAKLAGGVNLAAGGKVAKPAGWQPPDVEGVLERARQRHAPAGERAKGAPVLRATLRRHPLCGDEPMAVVDCPECRTEHYHRPVAGHVEAHCFPASRYHATGYVIELPAGEPAAQK